MSIPLQTRPDCVLLNNVWSNDCAKIPQVSMILKYTSTLCVNFLCSISLFGKPTFFCAPTFNQSQAPGLDLSSFSPFYNHKAHAYDASGSKSLDSIIFDHVFEGRVLSYDSHLHWAVIAPREHNFDLFFFHPLIFGEWQDAYDVIEADSRQVSQSKLYNNPPPPPRTSLSSGSNLCVYMHKEQWDVSLYPIK